MSQIDQFLNYLSTLNESTIQLTKQDYQKICSIRDKVTELAVKVSQTQAVAQPKSTLVKEKAKSYMEKIKETNPEKLKEWRHQAYLNRKEKIKSKTIN